MLASALVLLLVGAVYGVEEFLLLAMSAGTAFVVGLSALAWSTRRARRTLSVELIRPSGELMVGVPVEAAVVVSSEGRRPTRSLWFERDDGWTVTFPGLPALATARPVPGGTVVSRRPRADVRRHFRREFDPVPLLESGRSVEVPVPVPTDRRGLWSMAPRRFWCLDPLGLVSWPSVSSPPLHVVVCPPVAGDGTAAAASGGAGHSDVALEAHGHTTRSRGGGDDLAGLRWYVPGDRLNRLHWPAVARTGDLVVRDFVEPEARRVEVFVDDRARWVDDAVTGAAAEALSALYEGTVVELVTRSGPRLTVAPGPTARTVLLEALAVVAPTGGGLL